MVFKLVRIDAQEPSKIQVTIGTHVIGRGKFLHNDETDKRVSRNHAELEVTPDTICLKSLHQNPCFFIKKSIETHLLHQDSTVYLCHGDKFGLLPDHFWYEVLCCPDQDDAEERATIPEPTSNGVHNDEEDRMDQTEGQDNVTPDSVATKAEEVVNFVDGEQKLDPIRSSSPSLLTEQETAQQITTELETAEQVTESPKQEPVDQENTEVYDPPPEASGADDARSAAKRDHGSTESSPVDVKKVKTEHVDAGDAAAGPSNGQQAASDTDKKDNIAAPASPTKPTAPARERCIYGANCYRRNPAHKAQFSHPQDADWGGGERGECPYGRHCRRREPRHWLHHTHPPEAAPPAPHAARPGMQVVQRHGNVYYINAHSVNFYDDHFQVEDSDGDSVDFDYEF